MGSTAEITAGRASGEVLRSCHLVEFDSTSSFYLQQMSAEFSFYEESYRYEAKYFTVFESRSALLSEPDQTWK
jgi:hypothetical protein